MQDLLLLVATLGFFSAGVLVPFVMSLGYVWVDMFSPHLVSASILSGLPISLTFAVSAIVLYLLRDRKYPPKTSAILWTQLLLCIWITLTSTWAVRPDIAWERWDPSIKVALFATFLPYVIRSRVQIAAHTVPWGMKTLLTGGGYNQQLGLLRGNQSLLEDSSVISAVCVMMAPFALVWQKHSILLPKTKLIAVGIWSIIVLSLVASIGTFARTALVAFAVCGGAMLLRAKRKVLFLCVASVLGAVMFAVTSDKWLARINTVNDYENESSAYVRVLVWRWTLEFSTSHPFGGGFWAYVVNRIELPGPNGSVSVQYARAWHNIFIGLLGEHGYVGLGLYLFLVFQIFYAMRVVQRATRASAEHQWCADFAQTLQICLLTLLISGNFVEFGWQPVIWYLFSMAVALREYVRRAIPSSTFAENLASRGRGIGSDPIAIGPGFGVNGRPLPGRAARSATRL